jgi:hypothetical protein
MIRQIDYMDRAVKKGQQVPFDGVLVPVPHYKQCSESLQELPMCEQSLQESIQSGVSFGDYSLAIGAGALFGASMVLIFQHH